MTYDYLPLFIPIKNTTIRKLLIKDIYNTEIFNPISCTLSIYLSIYIRISNYHHFSTMKQLERFQTQPKAKY